MQFLVAMLGARMHYAVPRILHRAEILEQFFTDLCALKGWPRVLQLLPERVQTSSIRRILGRSPKGLPVAKITAFNGFGMAYARRRAAAHTLTGRTCAALWANRWFSDRVCAADWGAASGVFTFNCAGLEILQKAKAEGLETVMEQTIAPSALEQRLVREERELHPGWEEGVGDLASADYCAREQAEWPLADKILCGSEFVREGVARCGGPAEKCIVIPYGVDPPSQPPNPKHLPLTAGQRPLRVLVVGTVGLRKGSPYVLEAARQLRGRAQVRMVGSIGVTPEAEASLREYVELSGPLPRSEMAEQFAWADAFLLPSVCEGSATVTYEALAAGLPVVCTRNTGSVVRDGIEGFIVPIRDSTAIANRLAELAADLTLRTQMGGSARARAAEFTVETYGQRLLAALSAPVPTCE